jgi:hypothetical protein
MKDLFSRRDGVSGERKTETPDKCFREPDISYAPHAFWFWNGPLEPEHISKMAAEMCKQGMNPGYVHARNYKAHEPYWLSDEWYKSFQAAVESTENSRAHMTYTMGDPCFPDKYLLPDHPEKPRFPVGGAPLPSHPELKSESLSWTSIDVEGGKTAEIPASFFAVAAQFDADRHLSSSTLNLIGQGNAFKWTAPQGGVWRVYAFTKYHGVRQYVINFLDRRITEPWLKLENDKYEQLLSRHFGKTMQGVFFDLEGSYGYKIAWSDDLAKEYFKLKGVDIRLRMPLLVEEDADGLWAKARWDWFDVVGKVYVDCIIAPLDKWCRERGMFMTCHFWEEGLFLQAAYVANFMGAQRSYSMPGTDALFQTIHKPRFFKETQSVCEFEGRQFMCEMLGVAGWHLTPAAMKTAANSAIAMGLTHLVPHGVNSNRSLEKVSYPPDFFNWNPYWRHFHLWTDFSRRACYVNDHGHLDAKVLLLCPMDSVWALIGDSFFDRAQPQPHINDASSVKFSHAAEIANIDDAYTQAMNDLTAARIDHLIADSHYMKKMNVGENATLNYGPFKFKTLILPPLKLLPLEVAKRIADFAKAGGNVFALGSLPDSSAENGAGDSAMKRIMDGLKQAPSFVEVTNSHGMELNPQITEGGLSCPPIRGLENPRSVEEGTHQNFSETLSKSGLLSLINSNMPGLNPCVSFESGEFPLIASKRKIGRRSFLWLANNDGVRHECVLRVGDVSGLASIWNCEDGSIRNISSEELPDGTSRVEIVLEPYSAFWLVFDPVKNLDNYKINELIEKLKSLDELWTVSVDAGDQPVLAQHKLAAPDWLLKGGAKRPLESWLKWDLKKFSGFVDYSCDFEIESVSGDELLYLGEVKHMAEVWINGKYAGVRLWAPFKFEIGGYLQPDNNSVRVRVGNLVLNAVTQYENYKWKWHKAPGDDLLDAGLFGPVILCRQRI